MIEMNLFIKKKQTHRFRKQNCGYQRGEMWERNKLEIWDKPIHTTIFKTDNQQGPILQLDKLEKNLKKDRYVCMHN